MEKLKLWLAAVDRRAPFTWPRRRKWKWGVATILALAAYPVLVTLALRTGFVEWAMNSKDLRIEIQSPAYTVWPGRIRVKHVRLLVNGTTQFILEGDDFVMNLRLLDLVRRRVHFTELAAHDVVYQMRVQVKDTKGIEQRIAAYPPLSDLPGAKVVRETAAKATKKQGADWAVSVEGLDIAVKELWFFEYRYLGKGHLRGGFMVGSDVMQVSKVVQDLGPGELRFGAEQMIATNVNGQITADIPKSNPKEHEDASFMELVDARVNLRSDVESLANMSAYFPGVVVSRGKGPLSLDLYLDKGRLGSKSRLDYQTDSVRLKGNGFGIGTDLQLAFDAAGSSEQLPLIKTSSKSTYLSLARGMRSVTVQIHEHHEEAQLDTIQLSRSTDLKSASLRMPKIVCVDLKDLPAVLLPEGSKVEGKGGEAQATLSLDMDKSYWVHGPLTTTLHGVQLDADGVQVGGDIKLQTEVRFNPKLKVNTLQSMKLTMRDISMRAGGSSVADWWMNLDSKRLTLWDTEPARFEGSVSMRARDVEPALEALAQKDVIAKVIPTFTSLTDFRAGVTIRAAGPMTDVTLASESAAWDAAGRVYKNGKRSQMALVVGGKAVSLGIASDEKGLELVPFAKTQWLNDKLLEFPKPLVQMSREKP